MTTETWSRDRSRDLAMLLERAMPDEELSEDELLACCWDDPDPAESGDPAGVVLARIDDDATDEVRGAVAAVVRSFGTEPDRVRLAWVKLIAVDPAARRGGVGHELLAAIEAWAWDQGATELHLAGSAPFYLWPGVDAAATEMLCLVESRGYKNVGSDVNMALGTGFRSAPPEGVVLRRVITDDDVVAIEALLATHWPEWLDEARRAIEHGCCHGAFYAPDEPGGPRAVGFACHSVSRAGWLGPMGTDPGLQQGGVGSALLGQVCRDLQIAEFATTEICWVGPARFYAKNGATVSRVFRQYRLRRPAT